MHVEIFVQPLCKEERKGLEEEELAGNNNEKQKTENRHNGSNGSNGSNQNNGSNNDKEQTEKRHSWRQEMFEDQKVARFLSSKRNLFQKL